MNETKNALSGWLNINKPKGITSHDLVSKVRRSLKTKRVGHAGTLDPMATGVMVIAIGQATRLIQFLQEKKSYRAEVTLGITTSTLDAEGEITSEKPVDVSEEQVRGIIKNYLGKISQIPPMASAVHHNGVRLYTLARQGIEVERKPREVEIYSLDLISFSGNKFVLEVNCESGTYIRTLADDIGRDLGCGAHLSVLERINANQYFEIRESINIEDLIPENLQAVDMPLQHIPDVILNPGEAIKYLQGQSVFQNNDSSEELKKVFDENHKLLGIGSLTAKKLTPKVNLNL